MTTANALSALVGIATILVLLTGRASPNHVFVLDLLKSLPAEESDSEFARRISAA